MSASFKINGVEYSAGSELGPYTTLNKFIRKHANLRGTKKMCGEGGCGACAVHVSYQNPNTKETIKKSINSCMIPIYSCDGMDITTIEGLGDKKRGYHSIQKGLAEGNATQCGYCSPGFVMNMYGILAENPKPSSQLIEDSFDGNLCRCTGYGPIMKVMQSFSGDKKNNDEIPDIEDANKACCGKKGYTVCNNSCKIAEKSDYVMVPSGLKTIKYKGGTWHRPESLDEMLKILKETKDSQVRIVVGNTGKGIFKSEGPYDHYIDPKSIPELYQIIDNDDEISFGSAVTLSQLREALQTKHTNSMNASPGIWAMFYAASQNKGWEFCKQLAHHIGYVAGTLVRNAGCWAGNLMLKHGHNDFPSDMFTIMETVGATLTIANYDGSLQENVKPSEFLKIDMKGKMLKKLTLKKHSEKHVFRSFKITIRAQNAHAYINAGFLFELENFIVKSKPSIVFGGVCESFIHASKTEEYLVGKSLLDQNVITAAIASLDSEIIPTEDPVLSSVEYRKSLCQSLFYKYVLGILGDKAPACCVSGGPNLERALSSENIKLWTDETEFPVNEPIPKVEALIQASGEAEYTGDRKAEVDHLYGAFVLSTVASATIADINYSNILKINGVVKVLTHKDIPGENNVMNGVPFFGQKEEMLASSTVNFAGQPLAIVIAKSQALAELAARQVKVEYKDVKKPILTIREAIEKKSFWDHSMSQAVIAGNVEDGFSMADTVLEGEIEFGAQYHFHMETQISTTIPTDVGLDVHSSTQMVDFCQRSIAGVLGIKNNSINMQVKRLGGAYGAKLFGSFYTAVGSALCAQITNKPVTFKLWLDTNMKMIGKRLPYLAKYKVGVTDKGKLTAVQIYYYNDSGASPNEQTGTAAVKYGDSAYYCKNWKLVPVPCKTNTPPNTSCRAPAWLQAVSFIEEIMENLAFKLKMDPYDLKSMNLIGNGQKLANGTTLFNSLMSSMSVEFREMCDYDMRKAQIAEFNMHNKWKKKGLSVIMMRFTFDYFGINFNSLVSIYGDDGTVAITHSGIEMGQGINTKVIQVCARELGIPISMIEVKPVQNITSPNNTCTGGSIASEMVCWSTIRACEELKARMAPIKKSMKNPTWVELVQECYKKSVDLCAKNTYTPKDVPDKYDIYGMTATEVEVDVLTGVTQIPRVDMLYDGGLSLSPLVDLGQIQGAFVMGIGMMLSEEIKHHPENGELLTKNTWEYKPPTSKDIPIEFNIQFLKNVKNPLGVLGSKATGEPSICMSPTVLYAVRDAIQSAREDAGVKDRFTLHAPATPEHIQSHCKVTADRMKV